MEGKIIFNKKNNVVDFKLNKEKPFFKITYIEIPSIPRGSQNMYSLLPKFKITYNVHSNQGKINAIVPDLISYMSSNQMEAKFKVDETITTNSDQIGIKFNFFNPNEKDEDVVIHYTQFEHKVDIKSSSEDFKTHIMHSDNVKILFSAPFGQGKTTFLNLFFEANQDKYEVFKLYPVNYAVSHNEDIFKYIKAEILFQLMGKDVEFDKINFNYSETVFNYFSQNIDKILSPLVKMLPKVNETAGTVFDKIFEIYKAIKKHKSKLNIDDEKGALKYINKLYEDEGSIFEDNFYTQLIRQSLEQHQENHKKQNVLIIDDIDRMDPDHIFRIFNVFSANFDSNEYRIGLTNKFGFDKIILVCDYGNIKKLFKHRYGSSAAFDGYLGKYYSRNPYYYDNIKSIEVLTESIVYGNRTDRKTFLEETLLLILRDLISTNEITLRDLLNFQKYKFFDTVNKLARKNSINLRYQKHKFLYFNIIAYLGNIFDLDSIKEKISRCRNDIKFKENVNYSYYTEIGLVPLGNYNISNVLTRAIMFQEKKYNFTLSEKMDIGNSNYDYFEPKELQEVGNRDSIKFDVKDFYEVLLLNVDKYKEE